jgi:hypothetical protein
MKIITFQKQITVATEQKTNFSLAFAVTTRFDVTQTSVTACSWIFYLE